MKDNYDNMSFTIKSRDDLFAPNHMMSDFSFANVESNKDWISNVSPSPMTRSMRNKERDSSNTPTRSKFNSVLN